MTAQYTAETVQRIRAYAHKGWPPGATALMLGWELPRLQRIAAHHAISFPVPKNRIKETGLPSNGLRWDGSFAWFNERSIRLMPAEGRLFEVISRSPDYPWTAFELQARCNVSKNSIRSRMSHLRRKLKGIGLKLSVKCPYRLEGV